MESVSVTSSPILRSVAPPQHGHAVGARMHDALARQLSWQWPPRRPLAFEGFHLDDDSSRCGVSEFSLCLRLCRILFQVSELKLKLLQDGAALRRLPELCVAQLCA